MKLAVVYGGSQGVRELRAGPLAQHLGCPLFDASEDLPGRFDTIVLVKRPLRLADSIRSMCDRLIWDPLDCWRPKQARKQQAAEFWQIECAALQPDALIATSPSCRSAMLHTGIPVEIIPHAADPRIDGSWGNPDGPVVYYGYPQFAGPVMAQLFDAACDIGRVFVPVDHRTTGIDAIRGASLHICLRWKPHDYELNRLCKPLVKLENAAAAGVPVLASGHDCITSQRPDAYAISHKKCDFAKLLNEAMWGGPLGNPYTMDRYVADMERVIMEARSDQ